MPPGVSATSSKPSVQASTQDGWTALHEAADAGRLDVARLLLERGAAADAQWNFRERQQEQFDLGVTPLHLAAASGAQAVVELLLEHHVNVNALRRRKTQERIEAPNRIEERSRLSEVTALDLAKPPGGPTEALIRAKGGLHGPTFLKADEVFRRGKNLVQSGKIPAAVAEFRAAMEIYREHFAAAEELAVTLAQLAAPTPQGNCQVDWARQARDAMAHLLELDEAAGKVTIAGPAFDAIRPFDFILQVTLGESAFANHVESFITGKTFRTSCPGSSYCPVRQLSLHRNHRFTELSDAEPDAVYRCLQTDGCQPRFRTVRRTGTWRMAGQTVELVTSRGVVERLTVENADQVGELFWPDPNDMSGEPSLDREGCAF